MNWNDDRTRVRSNWSKSQINRIGERYKADPRDPSAMNDLTEVALEFTEIASELKSKIETSLTASNWRLKDLTVTDRVKSRETMLAKMRERKMKLSNMQDFLGLRVEADMDTETQLRLGHHIANIFESDQTELKNYLDGSGHSGYRAVHVWLDIGVRVEIQVRTKLQGQWANMYEAAADVFGRTIRYDMFPEDPQEREIVTELQALSLQQLPMIEAMEIAIIRRAAHTQLVRARFAELKTPMRLYWLLLLFLYDLRIRKSRKQLIAVKSRLINEFQRLEMVFRRLRAERDT